MGCPLAAAVDAHVGSIGDASCMATAARGKQHGTGLKHPMPDDLQPEHRPAELDRPAERSTRDVLDDPRLPSRLQRLARPIDQRFQAALLSVIDRCMGLTRRTGMNRVELIPVSGQEFQGIRLMERKRVSRLWTEIDANDVKLQAAFEEAQKAVKEELAKSAPEVQA